MEVDSDTKMNTTKGQGAAGSLLPPCQICGGQSSGYHYGANTCEACKAFFRRTLKKSDVNYPCICDDEKSTGEVLKDDQNIQKSLCPACRYQKCLNAGMSKDAVKIGRYSLAWKSKNIQEMKRIRRSGTLKPKKSAKACDTTMLMELQPSQSPLPSSPSPSPSSSSSSSFTSKTTIDNQTNDVVMKEEPSSTSSRKPTEDAGRSQSQVGHSSIDLSGDTDVNQSNTPVKLIMPTLGICTCELKCPIHSMFALTHRQSVDLEAAQQFPEEKMDSVIAELCEVQERLHKEAKIPPEDIHKGQKEFSELYQLQKELFGDVTQLSYQEFTDVYTQTGIDIDNRLAFLMDHITILEHRIGEQIKFAKAIPGFCKLPISDQANLVKHSRVETTMLSDMLQLNNELGVVTWVFGKQIHLDQIRMIVGNDFVRVKTRINQRLQDLHLTREERVLLQAVVILQSDRCSLEKRAMVEDYQCFVIACLRYVVDKQHSHPQTRLANLFSLLVALRQLTSWETRILRKIVLDYPITQKYSLVREMLE